MVVEKKKERMKGKKIETCIYKIYNFIPEEKEGGKEGRNLEVILHTRKCLRELGD